MLNTLVGFLIKLFKDIRKNFQSSGWIKSINNFCYLLGSVPRIVKNEVSISGDSDWSIFQTQNPSVRSWIKNSTIALLDKKLESSGKFIENDTLRIRQLISQITIKKIQTRFFAKWLYINNLRNNSA